MVDLPNTMVDLPNTMVDLPNTMVNLTNTMVDLPNTRPDQTRADQIRPYVHHKPKVYDNLANIGGQT